MQSFRKGDYLLPASQYYRVPHCHLLGTLQATLKQVSLVISPYPTFLSGVFSDILLLIHLSRSLSFALYVFC